eukprot:SAG11_NODE_249_length_11637_cov_3.320073_10_plen_76_part_00
MGRDAAARAKNVAHLRGRRDKELLVPEDLDEKVLRLVVVRRRADAARPPPEVRRRLFHLAAQREEIEGVNVVQHL